MVMDHEEVSTFLNRTNPPYLGVIGTLSEDGFPSLTPVWYQWTGTSVNIWSSDKRGWVRNLQRDNRVSFSVQDGHPPYPAVVMRGHASVTTSESSPIRSAISSIVQRYLPREEVEKYIADWPKLNAIVSIYPMRIASWQEGG